MSESLGWELCNPEPESPTLFEGNVEQEPDSACVLLLKTKAAPDLRKEVFVCMQKASLA